MNCETFTDKVIARLPTITDARDSAIVHGSIGMLYNKLYTVDDAVAWLRCLEEVVPGQDETEALARMARIESRPHNRV